MIHGCGLEGMEHLAPGSVDMVLCDLPSGETAAAFDVPVDLTRFFALARRCLKLDGTMLLMASSFRFAAQLVDHGQDWYRYDMVWKKSIATGFMNTKHRPLRAHEFALVFFRKQGTFNPQMVETGVPIHKNSTRGRVQSVNYGSQYSDAGIAREGATDRFPRSVLDTPCLGVRSPKRHHPQQKPDELFRSWIRTYTNPGELVIDPCAGSGTTERAATAEGRQSICWDIQERFAAPKEVSNG